ncbi:MAG: ABC transporter permease [Bacteroidota bacterium]
MESPGKRSWRKFRRNWPAMLGLGYAILCLIVAILAYPLAPDASTHANFQIIELAKQPPGTQAWILLEPTPQREESWTWVFTGKNPPGLPHVLQDSASVRIENDRVYFTRLSGAEDYLNLDRFGAENQSLNLEDFTARYVQPIHYRLGSDSFGRDLLSRIMLGARVSLAVGLISVLISLLIGITLGTLAGYLGGWVDAFVMWFISVMWSLPTLLLALAISFVLGKGFWQVFVAIGVSMWVDVARIVRGQILSLREQNFAEAAEALGYKKPRIMFRHILPNVVSPIIVVAVANFGAAVLIEAGLSFLGIGVELPIPSWGSMISEAYTYIVFETGKWLAIFPGLALVLLVVSINLIGIGLRDALDVRM